MINRFLQGKDCLSWCYIFVPVFEDYRFLAGVFLVTLVACFTCRGLICFTISMTCLVFWTLTCLQCPLPCHHYREMCDKNHPCSEASFSLWGWPVVTSAALAFSYVKFLHKRGLACFNKGPKNVRRKEVERLEGEDAIEAMEEVAVITCTHYSSIQSIINGLREDEFYSG